jgi:hypothetical protein
MIPASVSSSVIVLVVRRVSFKLKIPRLAQLKPLNGFEDETQTCSDNETRGVHLVKDISMVQTIRIKEREDTVKNGSK